MSEYICVKNEKPKHAYSISKGDITCIINDNYKFTINIEDTLFLGIFELLIQEADGNCPYLFSIFINHENTEYKIISLDEIKIIIKDPEKGIKVLKDLAKLLIHLDKIFIKMSKDIGEKEKVSQNYAKIFTETIDELGNFVNEYKITPLEKLYTDYLNSMTYAKGKAFKDLYSGDKYKLDTSFYQLDEYTKKFPRGTYICEQDQKGDELYILKQGLVRVYIDNNPITEIEKPGTIIGEMMFFSDGKRKASLQAVKNTTLAVIKRVDLLKILKTNPNFLNTIAQNISRHIFSICKAIEKLNDKANINTNSSEKEKEDLRELRNNLY